MAGNKESLIFQYDSNNHLSDIDDITEEKIVQKKLLEVMYMFQQYYGIIEENEYVLRESVLECFYGTKYAKFDCEEDHGILKDKYPVMTTKDYLEENIHNFGSCLCPEKYYKDRLPMTRAMDAYGKVAKKAACNEFPHICVPLVSNGQGWEQVKKDAGKVLAKINTNVYSELLLDNAVLACQYGGLIMIKEVPDVERDEPEEGNLLTYLSVDYVKWLIKAEGGNYRPYRDTSDKDEEQAKMNVTITPGITFNMTEKKNWTLLHDYLGWEDVEIENIINTLYGDDAEAKQQIQMRYQITPEQARGMFIELSQDYIELVNGAIKNYRMDGECYHYTQQQLEAMFDVAYNQGLNLDEDIDIGRKADIDNTEKIIYCYLRIKEAEAVHKVEQYWDDLDPRRRVNQMYLFFRGSYNFKEDITDYKKIFGIKK